MRYSRRVERDGFGTAFAIERDGDYADWASEYFAERRQDYVVDPLDGVPCCGVTGFCDARCRELHEEQFAPFEGTSCDLADRPTPTDPDDIDF